MKEKSALDGCTFRPEIGPKSEMLMNRRIQRMQISGSLYEHLYEDAQRRQERQLEYNSFLPPGVTFQPQVNNSQIDYSREDSLNRSAISKSNSESRLSSMRSRSQDREDSINDWHIPRAILRVDYPRGREVRTGFLKALGLSLISIRKQAGRRLFRGTKPACQLENFCMSRAERRRRCSRRRMLQEMQNESGLSARLQRWAKPRCISS